MIVQKGDELECLECANSMQPEELIIEHQQRWEYDSSPDETMLVVDSHCPYCGTKDQLLFPAQPADKHTSYVVSHLVFPSHDKQKAN